MKENMNIREIAKKLAIDNRLPRADRYDLYLRDFDGMVEVLGWMQDPTDNSGCNNSTCSCCWSGNCTSCCCYCGGCYAASGGLIKSKARGYTGCASTTYRGALPQKKG